MIEFAVIAVLVLVFWNPIVMNIAGPFIVWKSQKLPAKVKFSSVDESVFMEERNEAFGVYDAELSRLKFEIIGSSLLTDSHTISHFRLYWHAGTLTVAMIVSMRSKLEDVTYLEFTQKYTDQTVISVNNSAQPEAYPKIEFKKTFRLPNVNSAEKLLACHAVLKYRLKPDLDAVVFDIAGGFRDVEKLVERESNELLKMGLVKSEVDDNGKRALTLVGAFALTFRSVPPGKHIWGYLNEKKARKLVGNV